MHNTHITCVYVYIYIYIHIYTHITYITYSTHIYIYIYIYTYIMLSGRQARASHRVVRQGAARVLDCRVRSIFKLRIYNFSICKSLSRSLSLYIYIYICITHSYHFSYSGEAGFLGAHPISPSTFLRPIFKLRIYNFGV